MGRKKKILEKLKSLEEQKLKHKGKIESYKGKKSDILNEYWEKEIARMDAGILEEKRKLKK